MKILRSMAAILSDLYDGESTDFALVYDNQTLFSSADVLSALIDHWGEWYWVAPGKDQMNTVTYFVTVWKRWMRRTIDNFGRSVTALFANYDPISNYDLNEAESTGHKIDDTTNTTTPTGTATTTTGTKIYGFDSSTGANSDTVTTDNSYSAGFHVDNANKPSNTKTMDFNGTTYNNYHDAEERFLKRSGNIGVTTSQQMIESELALRKTDLLYDYLKQFIDLYCIFVG